MLYDFVDHVPLKPCSRRLNKYNVPLMHVYMYIHVMNSLIIYATGVYNVHVLYIQIMILISSLLDLIMMCTSVTNLGEVRG